MARDIENPDRNFSADGKADDTENLRSIRRAFEQSEPIELFDGAARGRFGQLISAGHLLSSGRRQPPKDGR